MYNKKKNSFCSISANVLSKKPVEWRFYVHTSIITTQQV